MNLTSQVVFHFYKTGHVAAEVVHGFKEDSVLTETLFFCLLVSRTLLEYGNKRRTAAHVTKWLNNFKEWASGLSRGTLGVNHLRRLVATNPSLVEFEGMPGQARLIATLALKSPDTIDYRFDVDLQGRFGLFGTGKDLAYGEAMVAMWSLLLKSRIDDLQYAIFLNTGGFIVGTEFFSGKLSKQTELAIIRQTINKVIELQHWTDEQPPEKSQYAINLEGLRQAAKEGDSKSQFYLGMLYEEGSAMLKDYDEAVIWYRKAAESGFPEAQCSLAQMYYYGRGVPQDYSEAEKWFLKAADAGHEGAQAMLGLMYDEGVGVARDSTKALMWYRKAAEIGSEVAQTRLGFLYAQGLGVPQDYSEAARWLRQAAERGYPSAQANLAIAYENGWGVSQDYSEAVKWYQKAAEQGHPVGKFGLGSLMADGLGIAHDFNEGMRLIGEAAEQGHAGAQYLQGCLYEKMEKRSDALKWYHMAAENGHEQARQKLKELV